MATNNILLETNALRKSIAHILKYHRSDCIGVLLGHKQDGTLKVTDAVPLFHERVMASTTEAAMEMIDCMFADDKEKQIVGVYDAPLRVSNDPK